MTKINAQNVHETLGRHMLADGLPFVFDLEKSHGSWLHDQRTGKESLDFFTCFASWPVGYNHPRMSEPEFLEELHAAASVNLANSDLYTESMARFVDAFATRVTPEGFPHHFFVQGGALAVENTLKVAFDWKARKLGRTKMTDSGDDLVILHFEGAFHGRTGYTMSLTNTDPAKIGLFPKFDWPRVSSPYIVHDLEGGIANDVAAAEAKTLAEIDAAFAKHDGRIAGILLEPMQGEGGDRHFRPEFFRALRKIADEREALLIFDEVQTGFYGSGSAWLWQTKDVAPDIVAFGKKTQICGLYSSTRVDDVEDNVFHMSSRINSTWGGNLVDMVRCRQFIEIIQGEKLHENVTARGEQMLAGLRGLAKDRGQFSDVRGIGSFVAFGFETPDLRNSFLGEMLDKGLLALSSGDRSIRMRMPLVVTAAEIDEALNRISGCVTAPV